MATKKKQIDTMPMFGPSRGLREAPKVKNRRGIFARLWKYLHVYRLGLIGISVVVVITTGLTLLGPYLTGLAIDKYIARGDLHGLARLVLLMVGLYIVAMGGMYVQSVAMIHIAQRVVRDIRRDLFDHLHTLSLRFFDRQPHGEIMSRLTNDTETISATLADGITQLIGSVVSVTGAGCIMFALNWKLALVGTVPIPLILIATKYIADNTRQGFRDRQESMGSLNGLLEETIMGQRVVKVCGRESEVIGQFDIANDDLRRKAIRALTFIGLMGPMMNFLRNFSFAFTAGIGGWMVASGVVSVGMVMAFINYADYFSRPLSQLASIYGTIQSALAGAERIFAVMDENSEMEDSATSIEATNIRGEIEFKNVCFGYNEDVPVLKDVSFSVEEGQTLALVGSTGAGKTTIINLLTRFYDIDSGAIRIDGHDIRDFAKDSLRRSLGIVLQDTYLFTDTVRENIRYGRLNANDEEVEAAARMANAESFIRHLPKGFDTVLQDAGSGLSQGQRQLVAIARTLLADPAILILDEATSSVDTRTEIQIQQALHRLMSGRTSFIIAHRLNTIRQADCILVIEDGRVIEHGTHEQLLDLAGHYHNLYTT